MLKSDDVTGKRNAPGASAITCAQDMTNADRYRGSAAALVQAGLVAWNQLPGQPGCPSKTVASFLPDGRPARRFFRYPGLVPGSRRVRRLSAERYEVLVAVGEEEQKRRHGALMAEFAEAKAARDNKARGELLKRNLVATPAEYRLRQSGFAQGVLRTLRSEFFSPYNGGFGVDEQSLAAFDAAAGYLVHTIAQMTVTYDARRHMQALQELGVDPGQVQVQAAAAGPSRGTLRLVHTASDR